MATNLLYYIVFREFHGLVQLAYILARRYQGGGSLDCWEATLIDAQLILTVAMAAVACSILGPPVAPSVPNDAIRSSS